MKNYIIYSPIFKSIFNDLPYTNDIEKVNTDSIDYLYIVYYKNEDMKGLLKHIINIRDKVVVLFRIKDFKNGLDKYNRIGIKKFLPLVYLNFLNEVKEYYNFRKILNTYLPLPKNIDIKIDNDFATFNINSGIVFKIDIENDFLNAEQLESMYYEIILNETKKLSDNKSNIKLLMQYFKDIRYRNKITTEIVKENLGKEYAEFFEYFNNIKKRYLNVYESFQKLQFKFKKMYSLYPEPVAIIDKNFQIEDCNPSFNKFFGKIKNLKDISQYEYVSKGKKGKIFESLEDNLENGIVKIFTDKYYVFKFGITKLEDDKFVIYFSDITESDIFEVISVVKLTIEEARENQENFDEFVEYITWILNEIFEIKSFIKLKKNNEEKTYGFKDLSNVFKLSTKEIEIHMEFPIEFREENKKDVSKTFLKACESKLYSDRIKNYNKEIEKDLNIARYIQNSIVKSEDNFSEPQFILHYEPSHTIGGDFAITNKKGDNFVFSVGDVSGHGIASALMSIYVNTVVKETIDNNIFYDIERSLKYIKQHLYSVNLPEYMFAALLYGNLDLSTNILSYASGGFQFPMILKRHDEIMYLPTGGGIFSSAFDFEQEYNKIKIKDTDMILAFTDGVVELKNDTDEVLDFIKNTLSKIKTNSPIINIKILLNSLKERYKIEKFDDDITLLGFRKKSKNYDIEVFDNHIYSVVNLITKENLEIYFKDLIEKICLECEIKDVIKKNFLLITNKIINERINIFGNSPCELKIDAYKENNALSIILFNCKSKAQNDKDIKAIEKILNNIPVLSLKSSNKKIELKIKL